MDCLSTTSDVEEVVFMKRPPRSGTEAILNAIGYIIDHAPGPMIFVQPTVDLAKRASRQRIDPLITITPCIARKVADVAGARQRQHDAEQGVSGRTARA
jgi:phage terminase large subunit GpA-like protein